MPSLALFLLRIFSIVSWAICALFVSGHFFFTLAGIVGFVWLLILGEWSIAGCALLIYWAGSVPLGLAMLPGRLFFPIATQFIIATAGKNGWLLFQTERDLIEYIDNKSQFFLKLQALLICATWCTLIFTLASSNVHPNTSIPIMLVAQVLAVDPMTSALKAQAPNPETVVFSAASRLGSIVAAVSVVSLDLPFPDSSAAFLITIPVAFQLFWRVWKLAGFNKVMLS